MVGEQSLHTVEAALQAGKQSFSSGSSDVSRKDAVRGAAGCS